MSSELMNVQAHYSQINLTSSDPQLLATLFPILFSDSISAFLRSLLTSGIRFTVLCRFWIRPTPTLPGSSAPLAPWVRPRSS